MISVITWNQKSTKLFGKPLRMVLMAEYDSNMRSYRLNMMNCKQSMTSSKMKWETLMPSKLNGKSAKRSEMRYRKK